MAIFSGPKIELDGLVTKFDVANSKSFQGTPTTNFAPMNSAFRYNNPGFSGTIVNTGETFKGAPIWEATFIPQSSGFISRLGSTEGFGFRHLMGTSLIADTPYMASIYFKTDFPLLANAASGFSNIYSNISGWGNSGTATTRFQEGEFTRLYSRYLNRQLNIGGVIYAARTTTTTISATVNTTATTDVLLTLKVNANGSLTTTTSQATLSAGSLINYGSMVGLRSASPTIINNGGISGLSTGTSAVINHGLNITTFTKLSNSNPVLRSNFPFDYFILLRIPSTNGLNVNITYRHNFAGFYSSLSDSKFWKITFDVSNLQVGQVIKTYWAAPMIEQRSFLFPSEFVIGTRGGTKATGGGWTDLSKKNNHATFINGPFFNRLNAGSLVFDGSNQSANMPQPNINFNPNRFTVSFWIKPGNQSSRFLTPQSNGIDQYLIYDNANQRINIAIAQSADTNERTRVGTANTVKINEWTNFVFSIDNFVIKMHINGVLTNQYTETISIGNWSSTWFLGQRGNNTFFFLGEISNFSVYDKVLNNQQIKLNYEAIKGRYDL